MKKAAWDFNGDGRADFVIGFPTRRLNDGDLEVRYGTPTGLSEVQVLSDPHLSGKRNKFAFTMTSADFDRDGFDDLAVGVPDFSMEEWSDDGGGTVLVYHGAQAGLVDRPEVILDAPSMPKTNSFGTSMVAGDFNGDRLPDLAVSGPNAGPPTWRLCLTIFWGSGGGLTAHKPQITMLPEPMRPLGESVLASGDVNGDRISDLVFGSGHQERRKDPTLAWLPGSSAGLGTPQFLSASGPIGSLVVADITGDGYREIIAGVPEGNLRGPGRLVLFAGSSNGMRALPSIAQRTPGVPGDGVKDGGFGSSVAVADVLPRRGKEVLVGTPGANEGTGTVTVLRWGKQGLKTSRNEVWAGESVGGGSNGLGLELVALDFTGDGFSEVAATTVRGWSFIAPPWSPAQRWPWQEANFYLKILGRPASSR